MVYEVKWKSSKLPCSLVCLDIEYKLPNSLVDPGVWVVKMLVLAAITTEKYIGENRLKSRKVKVKVFACSESLGHYNKMLRSVFSPLPLTYRLAWL